MLPFAAAQGLWDYLGALRPRIRVHSAWVGEFYDEVLKSKKSVASSQIEALRQQLALSPDDLVLHDLGASGDALPERKRATTVGHLARTGARRPYTGQVLAGMVQWLQPQAVLELGTQLGLATAYLEAGLPQEAMLVTIEGDPTLAQLARAHWGELGIAPHRITLEQRSFEDYLQQAPSQPWGFVFLDGRHTYASTHQYIQALIPHLAEEAVVVLDDIYWSSGMRKAWRELKSHPTFPVSVDLYRLGVLVKRPQAREHFALPCAFWRR